jgi:hypothetical protein
MSKTNQGEGQTRRIVYNSGSSADTSWNTNPGAASWVLIEGVGTTVLLDETGATFSCVTDALMPNKALPGPWTGFTSTTATRVTMGNGGRVPPVAVPASAVPATSSSTGGVQLSVAPAVAATPIAVGANDARVDTIYLPINLSGTDGTLAEVVAWRAPYNCTITGAFITAGAAMAANNTDFDTFTLANRPLAGPGTPANIAVTTTKAADLNALAAYVEKSLATSALTNTAVLVGDMLTFKSVIGGAGKASGPGLLRITFSVP